MRLVRCALMLLLCVCLLTTVVFADGTTYEGEWQNGKRHGYGICVMSEGTVYEGEWQGGKYHGYGKEVAPDGTVREGEWQEGEFLG